MMPEVYELDSVIQEHLKVALKAAELKKQIYESQKSVSSLGSKAVAQATPVKQQGGSSYVPLEYQL